MLLSKKILCIHCSMLQINNGYYMRLIEKFNALPYDLPKGGLPPCYWNQDCGDSGGV